MSYVPPLDDLNFALRELVDIDTLAKALQQPDVNDELVTTILDEAGRLASEVLDPLYQVGDHSAATLQTDGVHESPGFATAYRAFMEGGWTGIDATEEFGGQNLPHVLATALQEIWQGANMAFALCPLLSMGAIHALSKHANVELQQRLLPELISGNWTATMNLTESDAGSDLAAVRTKAIPEDDHYLISGQKIFITWGEHQMTENIIHLVLARLPDAPAGVKGISLFVVPRYLLSEGEAVGDANNVSCVSLEHKLGIHGSPTCVMSFENAVGYLAGEENKGLACMFTMMNHARQSVGVQGLAISERATQMAFLYARERIQGSRRDGSPMPIIEHPDVARMLLTLTSGTQAMRAVALIASAAADYAQTGAENAEQAWHRHELFTPIVKGWCTEFAQELVSLALQVFGGMGYIEETGIAQVFRDARILPIYEGTTGIQALDFIQRKTLSDKGVTLRAMLEEMRYVNEELKQSPYAEKKWLENFSLALEDADTALAFVLKHCATDRQLAGAVSVAFLMLNGYLCGGWLMLRTAVCVTKEAQQGKYSDSFLATKKQAAGFYLEQILPRTASLQRQILNTTVQVLT